MAKKKTEQQWVTYIGDHQDPEYAEIHEDEPRAKLRTFQDPSRQMMALDLPVARKFAAWINPIALKADFYSEENLKAELDSLKLKGEPDLDEDFYWLTCRLARGRESEGIVSKPGYFQMHRTLKEAQDVRDQREEVSAKIGEGYQFDILFALKDLRKILDTSGRQSKTGDKLGRPEKPEEEKLKHSYAFHLPGPLLERYEEFRQQNPEWTEARSLRYLVERGMEVANDKGRLIDLPILPGDLNKRETATMLRPRYNEEENGKLQAFMKKFRIKGKQQLMSRLVYQALMAEGMPIPRGFPED